MGLRADSARPQRVSGSARTDSERAESARNPIASHVNFGDDSALNALMRTQWTAALTQMRCAEIKLKGVGFGVQNGVVNSKQLSKKYKNPEKSPAK